MKAYGQLAFHAKLNYMETAAYDLCTLLEDAYVASADSMLRYSTSSWMSIRTVGEVREAALRGVRKAQVKVTTRCMAPGTSLVGFSEVCHENGAHERHPRDIEDHRTGVLGGL